jgi:isocitrate dehydrogenase
MNAIAPAPSVSPCPVPPVSAAGASVLAPAIVACAPGDGIGPEIMAATRRVLQAAGAALEWRELALGRALYEQGHTSGIAPEAWSTLAGCSALLKGPITTPQGGGYKSLNVTLRKTLGLFANVRPCVSYAPFAPSAFPGMNVVVIRENEEDTYAGIEHRQTPEVVQCLKLITRPGCERICRYAFDYAQRHGRRKVTAFVKDNIMKLTDGLFHRVFREVAADYPHIETESLIVDIGAALLATEPTRFDVIVTLNLYGDIVSDIAAQVAGSIGLAGSANIGEKIALFEAVHGSAPDLAGRGVANPSALLQSAVAMLVYLGQTEVASRVHNAWLRTIEDGYATADFYRDPARQRRVGTEEFAAAVIARLGQRPQHLPPAAFSTAVDPTANTPRVSAAAMTPAAACAPAPVRELVGFDVFLHWDEARREPERLATGLIPLIDASGFRLTLISNRGVKVWPHGHPATFRTDHWRCRLRPAAPERGCRLADLPRVLSVLGEAGFEVIKTENLYTFDGQPGFSLGQGE